MKFPPPAVIESFPRGLLIPNQRFGFFRLFPLSSGICCQFPFYAGLFRLFPGISGYFQTVLNWTFSGYLCFSVRCNLAGCTHEGACALSIGHSLDRTLGYMPIPLVFFQAYAVLNNIRTRCFALLPYNPASDKRNLSCCSRRVYQVYRS